MAIISTRYFIERTVTSIFLSIVVLTILFVAFRIIPGDFTDIMLLGGASPEAIEQFKAQWGLDDPIYVQYLSYMENLLSGNAGYSLQNRQKVLEYVGSRVFNSFILIAPGITTAYIIGSIYGIITGTNRDSILDKYGIILILFLGATPAFFIAIMLVVVFSSWLGWFPTHGMIGIDVQRRFQDLPWWRPFLTADFVLHYTLPFIAVIVRYLFLPSLIMRTSVAEVLGQDFMNYHEITGIPKYQRLLMIGKHASLPVITMYPVSMTRAIGGLVLIEVVFNWPGIGFTLVQAVLARDFPVLQFVFLIMALFIIFSNYFIDILYGIIDPRVEIE